MADFKTEWREFLDSLRKNDKNHTDPNSLHSVLSESQLVKENSSELIISLPNEESLKKAREKFNRPKNQEKMPLKWRAPKRLQFCLLQIHPLQALKHHDLGDENDRPDPALAAAVDIERNCQALYDRLNERTVMLSSSLLEVEFGSRVRVGGVRGFLDTLLPALHPVYGVPYIPASTLKGILRAWMKDNPKEVPVDEVDRILGFIDRKADPKTQEKYEHPRSSLGTVQFFDAFPKKPCLDIDVVTPNWSWRGTEEVGYQAAPHAFLTMNCPTLVIGLASTSLGNEEDVELAMLWLEEALARGLGSRTSAGYGRVKGRHTTLASNCAREFPFEMKTQGMYGIDCPTKENRNQGTPEFRTTAVRGVLRYWFRAIALGIYSREWCKRLEEDLFGGIEPVPRPERRREDQNKPIQGSVSLSVELTKRPKSGASAPFEYKGKIYLEAQNCQHFEVVSRLLELASHLSGIGRGSRRPLHTFTPNNSNTPLDRGCFWQLLNCQYDADSLKGLVDRTIASVATIGGETAVLRPAPVDVGMPSARKQDVFNRSARLFVIPQDGLKAQGRGRAMELLYTPAYKGGVPGRSGNPHVGGAANQNLSTPSYVTIQTNLPPGKMPYEAVIVFDAASGAVPHGDMYKSRSQFCDDLLDIEGAIEIPLQLASRP
jgi:CRISPR-associated protein Cmr6